MSARRTALFALLLASTACSTRRVDAPPPSMGAQLSVERFLQAANARDVVAMGSIFGTKDGAAMETGSTFSCAFKKMGSWFGGEACTQKMQVEIRMDAIASILLHQDYRIVGQSRVAGRVAPTQRVLVDMTKDDGDEVAGVPFVVVQTGNGNWLVEEIDLQRVMAAR